MTLDEARDSIGRKVVYRAPHVRPDEAGEEGEEGVITSVGDVWVFVRYGSSTGSQSTAPGDLSFASAATGGTE